MYYHEAMTHRVDWEPDHEAEAEQAMREVVERFDEWNGTRYKVDLETAQAVQARYRELVEANPDIDTDQ